MSSRIALWWIRRDLRLQDNLALQAALDSGAERVVPLFIFDPALLRGERFGLPRLKFMLAGLRALDDELRRYGGRMVIRQGDPAAILSELSEYDGVIGVFVSRDYSPYAVKRDSELARRLLGALHFIDDAMLHPPEQTLKGDGTPFKVYTPYKRRWLELPKPATAEMQPFHGRFSLLSDSEDPVPSLSDLGFGETIDVPLAGEAEAERRLNAFMEGPVFDYKLQRDILACDPFIPDEEGGTSGLSPYFRFGMISPRQAYAAAERARAAAENDAQRDSVDTWISEVTWREFYMSVLYHFPYAYNTSFRPEYEQVSFRQAPDELRAWQEGRTGYPVVDAAMRQMLATGWMHNRARMIVASFLTKDLLIYWREGDVYFMKRLIDGDPAANNGGWQWSAGTGTDAQPFFRIFNPVSQSQKFDPGGTYIRRWVPELRDVRAPFIHEPWTMSTPPKNYPPPIVDHHLARERALAAFKVVK